MPESCQSALCQTLIWSSAVRRLSALDMILAGVSWDYIITASSHSLL